MSLKIIVTGGAGFIGSALVRYLINHTNHSVVCLDALTYASNIAALSTVIGNNRLAFEEVNICDHQSIHYILNKYRPNIIMNLAAETHVDRSIANSKCFIDTNINGTHCLLEASLTYWSGLSESDQKAFRFHQISTDEVFGDLGSFDEYDTKGNTRNSKFSEFTNYAPSSPYSASKAAGDHLARAWYRTFGLPILITNCSNNYGPFQNYEKLIPKTITNALSGASIPLYGDGQQIRDWLFVDDHVKALCLVATEGRAGETYNIGGDCELANLEIVTAICRILDELQPRMQKYEEQIAYVNDRPGHDRKYAVDFSKIRNELGWSPAETFETGIRKTIQWYLTTTRDKH